ncbi:MAG: fimbrillin family protein [Bacteroidales bacterium]|nr:fimbrillin family protein [Bacteroidales bacterium]
MKKYFVFLGIAALTLAACSKTEIDETAIPDQKIEFNAANYVPQTRAGEVSLLGDTKFFSSKAYLHAEGVTAVQDYFGDKETITANDNTNPSAWLPSHDYYWPKSKNSYINFVSWFDKKGAPTTISETSLAWAGRTIATDDNIMWADEAWRFNNNDGAIYKKDAVSAGVPTLFHHALAKLTIKAKCDPVEKDDSQVAGKKTTWEVTLEDIKITGTFNEGTLTLTNSDSNEAAKTKPYETTGWVLPTTGTAPGITMNNTSVLTKDLVDVLAEQSVLPQTLDNAKLEFKLHIIAKYDSKKVSEEKIDMSVKLNTLGTTAITKWEMNTKYVYNIIINPETDVVKFDPAVIPWVEDANAPTYNVPAGQINS